MTSTGRAPAIRAAGGLVARGDTATDLQLAVVHRPNYDDWSLPKGKHDEDEASPACALREVEEETGFRCRIVGSAGSTRYGVRGAPKEVEYFLMRPIRFQGFRPDDEVDEMRWIGPAEANEILTYDFDRSLVANLTSSAVASHTTVHLVRHGAAGDRSRWEGPDSQRPLTEKGQAQSVALAEELAEVGIGRILTSPYLRCVQMVQPLAERTGRMVETTDDLAEGAGPAQITRLLEEAGGNTIVLCSHGDVIGALLERLEWLGARFLDPHAYKKGSTWAIGHDGTAFTEAFYFPPPPT